jgi:hypothetical protein
MVFFKVSGRILVFVARFECEAQEWPNFSNFYEFIHVIRQFVPFA